MAPSVAGSTNFNHPDMGCNYPFRALEQVAEFACGSTQVIHSFLLAKRPMPHYLVVGPLENTICSVFPSNPPFRYHFSQGRISMEKAIVPLPIKGYDNRRDWKR